MDLGNYSDNGDFTFESADPQRAADGKERKQRRGWEEREKEEEKRRARRGVEQ